jgi:phosphohistidine phosphatase
MPTRRLALIRHSKSAVGPVDHERPLADRGIRDAGAVGRWLIAQDVLPDCVIVSTAARARETWEVAAEVLGGSHQLVVDGRIYDNSVTDLLAVVHDAPKAAGTLFVVGHNPSMNELACALDDGAGDRTARNAIMQSYPTSGVCVFSVATSWKQLEPGGATVIGFAAPRG